MFNALNLGKNEIRWAAKAVENDMAVENRSGLRTTYTYDRENRVSAKNDKGNRTTMYYNGDGQRIVRQTPTGRTTFVWEGSDYLGEVNS